MSKKREAATARSHGMGVGVWLVAAGGLLVLAMTFVYWGVYSEKTAAGWSPWTWQLYATFASWTDLRPGSFFGWPWWKEVRGTVGQGLYLAWMVMTVLLVVAGIQALRRGLGGAPVNGRVLRAFGIASAVVFVAYEVCFVTDPAWRTLLVTDVAALIGAVLVIVGGTLMGPAPSRPIVGMESQGNVGGAAPPDWYPDPGGRHQHRYWDGTAWTSHVANSGSQSVDPLDGAPASNDRVDSEGSGGGTAPPDWYPDPGGRHQYRYWDGAAWTNHVANSGSQSLDHLEGAPASDDQASAKADEQAIVEETGLPAVEPLIAALGDPDLDVRVSAAAALVQISAPGFEPLIAALKDQNKDVRAVAAVTLGRIGDAAVEPLILALQQYPDKRSGVARILGQIGDPRAVEPLIVALKDQNDYVRQWAAHALGKIGDPRAVEPLSAALKDQNEDVRKWATYALGKIGVSAAEPLSAAREDQNTDVRALAVEARAGAPSSEADNMGTRPT